jgi:hypothetical protein
MSKVTIGCFSVLVLLLLCGDSAACSGADDCAATKINVDSFGISVRVVIATGGRETPAVHNRVEAFYRRQGEWQSIGDILEGPGGFGWKSEWVGSYKFVIRQEGLRTATLIVNVRSLRGRWNEFIVPLKANGCGRARLVRAGVK